MLQELKQVRILLNSHLQVAMRSYTLRQMYADGKLSFQTGFLFNQMKMVQPSGA